MADIERSTSDLLTTIFQDGQTNTVTANAIRDLVVSLRSAYGSTVLNVAAATTIATAGVYYKAGGTTTFDATSRGFDSPADMQLRYTGSPERRALISASVTVKASTTKQIIGVGFAIDGVLDTTSIVQCKVDEETDDVASVNIQLNKAVLTNQTIEIHVTNISSTADVTLNTVNFQVAAIAT